MRPRSLPVRALALCLAIALLSACAPAKDKAGQLVSQIDAALATVGPDAQKYVPDEFSAVLKQVQQLKGQMTGEDYSAVVKAAPAILAELQALEPKAAARKAEVMKQMEAEWARLEVSVPADIDAVDSLAKQVMASGKPPAGMSADAVAVAKSGMGAFRDFWKQAIDAKAAGNLEKAVEIGNAIKRRLEVLSVELGGSSS